MNIDIHWMYETDYEQVLKIEESVFSYPWSEEDFRNEIAQRNTIPMVADVRGRVVGYMIYELNDNSVVIVTIAVDEEFQRCGVGRQLVGHLTKRLNKKWKAVSVIVHERLLEAQLFFKACGFRCNKTYPMYFGGDEDAYRFDYSLTSNSRIKGVF